MIVDEMHEEHPELLRDQYWEEVVPRDLPYTVAAEHYRRREPPGSADNYKVREADAMYANLTSTPRKAHADDTYADYVCQYYHFAYDYIRIITQCQSRRIKSLT